MAPSIKEMQLFSKKKKFRSTRLRQEGLSASHKDIKTGIEIKDKRLHRYLFGITKCWSFHLRPYLELKCFATSQDEYCEGILVLFL